MPGRQPESRISWIVRSTCRLASGWKLIQVAPASANSGTSRSTGSTIRCTSIGALMPCLRKRLADQRTDREVRDVVVVHHVEVNPVGAGREHGLALGAEAREIRGQDRRRDDG